MYRIRMPAQSSGDPEGPYVIASIRACALALSGLGSEFKIYLHKAPGATSTIGSAIEGIEFARPAPSLCERAATLRARGGKVTEKAARLEEARKRAAHKAKE